MISGGNPGLHQEVVLCPYSSAAVPEQELPLFPTDPIDREWSAENCTAYDVYQSALFTPKEEEQYENTGAVPIRKVITPTGYGLPIERLFLNPRDDGRIKLHLAVTFDLNIDDPASPFIGHATVAITNRTPQEFPDPFILSIRVFETVVSAVTNEPAEQLADSYTLHFAPSFLVVDPEYFHDRAVGLEAMGRATKDVSDHYAISQLMLNPIDPISAIQAPALHQERLTHAFAAYQHAEPERARHLVKQYSVPTYNIRV